MQVEKKLIRVLHVIPSLSLVHGGPSRALPILENVLTEAGLIVETATTNDDGSGKVLQRIARTQHLENGVKRWYFPKQTEFYKVSRPFAKWLRNEIRRFDVVHVHALFSYTSVMTCRIAKKAGVPYVIRPLGVLNAYGINRSKAFLKKLSLRFIEGPLIRNASAIHFLTEKEMNESEVLPYPMRSTVIPMGVDFVDSKVSAQLWQKFPQLQDKQMVLFLGRLNVVKGLELLLEAFSRFHKKNPGHQAILVLAGTGEVSYLESLKDLAHALGINDKVFWIGHVEGYIKSSLLSAAELFVVPSESESFGISMVEALGTGIPVIASPGVAIAKEVADVGACVVVERTPELWAEAIADLLEDSSVRSKMGERARSYALSNYSMGKMGEKLKSLYLSLINSPDE